MKTMIKMVAGAGAVLLSIGCLALVLGRRTFNGIVKRDVASLLGAARLAASQAESTAVVTAALLDGLPPPIRRYLLYTGVVGAPMVRSVYLRQKGAMRQSTTQPWLPLDAEQHYTVQPPGFVWSGTLLLGPLPLARARDRYADGWGNMLIRAGGIYRIADATGAEMDQGALMRYLSEMIWFPTAFLGENVSFEAVDDKSARVTLTDHGRGVSGTLHVDEEGRLTNFEAKRYRMVGGGYELTTWSAPAWEYGELAGLRLPTRGLAVWKLAEGDLAYFDVTITELAYDAVGETGVAHTTGHALTRRSTRLRPGASATHLHDAAS
jgi:hypothetical protein